MSISHSVCAPVSQESHIWEIESLDRRNTTGVVRAQTRKYNRGACNAGSHPYACRDTTESKSK